MLADVAYPVVQEAYFIGIGLEPALAEVFVESLEKFILMAAQRVAQRIEPEESDTIFGVLFIDFAAGEAHCDDELGKDVGGHHPEAVVRQTEIGEMRGGDHAIGDGENHEAKGCHGIFPGLVPPGSHQRSMDEESEGA